MKNRVMQLFLLLGLMIGISGLARAAAPYQVNIPFDFTVNGKLMKAGNYSVSFGISNANSGSFLIRSEDGKNVAIVNRVISEQPSKKTENTTFVFEKSGNEYSLLKINSSRVNVELYQDNKHYSSKIDHVELKATH